MVSERNEEREVFLFFFHKPTTTVLPITKDLKKNIPVTTKPIDEIFGGETGGQLTDATCEKCGCKQAFFFQLQIRSGDEGSTTFFKCKQCGWRWKDQ